MTGRLQKLAALYAQGRKHYEADHWHEALECFRRVQDLGGNYKHVDIVIAAIEKRIAKRQRKHQIAALYHEAQAALFGEDWPTAIKKLQTVVDLEPTHIEAAAKLSQAKQQQKLATLRARGRKHYDAGRWRVALEYFRSLRDIGGGNKDIDTLIATAERKMANEQGRTQVNALNRGAQAAIAEGNRGTAIEKLQTVVDLEPTHIEAAAKLSQAKQQQKLATLYARGRKHYDAGRWRVALEYFRSLRDIGGSYIDVDRLIATIEGMMVKEEAIQTLPRTSSSPGKWLWVGISGILGLLLIVFVGVFFVADGGFLPTPAPTQAVVPPPIPTPESPTPTPTNTPIVRNGPTVVLLTPTPTPTFTPILTPEPSPTDTPTPTATFTPTTIMTHTTVPPTPTATFTATPTETPTKEFTLTPVPSPTDTPIPTETFTPTPTPTFTPTPTATFTPTPEETFTPTPTPTPTPTFTPILTPEPSPTDTPTPTATFTPTPEETFTPTSTPTPTEEIYPTQEPQLSSPLPGRLLSEPCSCDGLGPF